MRRKLAAAIGVAVGVAVGVGGTAGPAAAQSEEEIEAQEIAAVGTAKVGLADAIAAAEERLGGKVAAGGLEVDADRLSYELLVGKDGGGFASARVDPATGAVDQAGEASLEPGKAVPPEGAKIDLAQAVRLAEAASGRKALEAGVEPREGAAVYVVEVVEEGDEVSVHLVDPASGRVSDEE